MEEGKGWIKLHRKIQDHWIWQEKRKFSKAEAWIDLLMMVNHEDKKVPLGNELILVKRGQRITSIRQLCDRWGWSNTKVTQFLKMMQTDGMLTVKSDTKKTVITIENYDVYQSRKDEKKTENSHESDTKQTQKHTNKNEKNYKNDKEKDSWLDASDPSPENEALKKIENHFIQRRGIGIIPSASDIESMKSLLDDNIPLSEIIAGIDLAFDRYKPKHRRDGIKRFAYCETVIRSMYQKKKEREQIQQQGGYNNAINGERGTQDSKDTSGKESSFITSSYYDQFEGLFGEGG